MTRVHDEPYPYGKPWLRWTATDVLAGVRQWADGVGYRVYTEMELETGNRVDGVMVPMRWDAPLLKQRYNHHDKGGWASRCAAMCLEIKCDRGDFMKGLKNGQFERYREMPFAGCYLATPAKLIRREEVPEGWG